jgi:parallel beta-helix repeat protein
VKTDSNGNKQWDKTFGGTDWDVALSVQQTSDGGYILAGGTELYGAGSGDFWLIKVSGETTELKVHNLNTGKDFSTIQSAIDDSNTKGGHTIKVDARTYTENVNVSKQLTIKSENGSANCIVDAGGIGSTFTLSADGVTIEGFTIKGGIRVFSNYNTILENNITKSESGIEFWNSNNNKILGNNISNNWAAMYFTESSNNEISGNAILNNWYGIFLSDSSNNKISGNKFLSKFGGLELGGSSNNKIYLNNFINNGDNVYSSDSTNIWNSPSKITYTYNGKNYEDYLGNYWDDYTGSGLDGDRIGDTPYSIDSDKDKYPLMQTWEQYFKEL